MELLLLCLTWAAYFSLHSFLASAAAKTYAEKQFPDAFSYYRMAFNALAIGLLLPLAYWTYALPQQLWWEQPVSKALGLGLLLAGMYFLYAAFRVFDTAVFLGLKAESHAAEGLVTKGMYRYVRHPLYFATLLLFWGLFLYWPSWKWLVINLLVLSYLIIGSRLEEQKLEKQFGKAYRQYKKEVKALIPFLY